MGSRYDDLSKEDLIRSLERRDARRALGLVWERDRIAQDAAHNDDFVALGFDSSLSTPLGVGRRLAESHYRGRQLGCPTHVTPDAFRSAEMHSDRPALQHRGQGL